MTSCEIERIESACHHANRIDVAVATLQALTDVIRQKVYTLFPDTDRGLVRAIAVLAIREGLAEVYPRALRDAAQRNGWQRTVKSRPHLQVEKNGQQGSIVIVLPRDRPKQAADHLEQFIPEMLNLLVAGGHLPTNGASLT